MKLTFLSNYYSHHQASVCDLWQKHTEDNFIFVATEELSEERKQLGWNSYEDISFVLQCSGENKKEIEKLTADSDVVILGNAPLSMVSDRLRDKKLVFKYSERVFKSGYDYKKWFGRLYTYWNNYGKHKSLYLLSASAYTAVDFAIHGTFIGKCYKWGYFPKTYHYDLHKLMSGKKTNKILWCGRFLDWKHPHTVLEVAKRLKEDGYDFEIDFIGTGELADSLEKSIVENNLSDSARILGSMTPDQVRTYMETAGIYLFTSDFREGWGAVLNESMNSGCAVVASHAIGSVPFLLKHRENGLIYKNGDIDDLYNKVKTLLDDIDEQRRLGENAYRTITELWNAEVASERFIKLAEEIKARGTCDLYDDGPCSKAKVIRNNWFKAD